MMTVAWTIVVGLKYSLVLLSAQGSGLSTANLDAYVRHVIVARKNCGPTAVWYCMKQLKIDASHADLCREAGIGADGTSLQSLIDLCGARGLKARGIVCAPPNVDLLPVPSIIVVDGTHCVVYQGVASDGRTVTYFEPSERQLRTASRDRVERNWTGAAIMFERPGLSIASFWIVLGLTAFTIVFLTWACARRVGRVV